MKSLEMINHAELHNGGTYVYNKASDEFFPVYRTSGYYVSTANGVENLPRLRSSVIKDFVADRWAIEDGVTFLGLWNASTIYSLSRWSVDESGWYENMHTAMEVGRINNQKAIWDVYNEYEITL